MPSPATDLADPPANILTCARILAGARRLLPLADPLADVAIGLRAAPLRSRWEMLQDIAEEAPDLGDLVRPWWPVFEAHGRRYAR